MINLSEQLSAARQTQLEAQLQFFNSFTSKAVASAEKLVALNLNLARETVEKSSTALCQAMTARDAADLFALTARTPDTVNRLLAYGRDLMSIAAGGAPTLPATPQQATARIEAEPAQETAPAQAPSAIPEAAPAAAPEVELPVAAKPIARALDSVGVKNGAARPAAASFPAADEVKVQITGIEPVDATPPPAPSAGTPDIVQEAPAAKGRKKK